MILNFNIENIKYLKVEYKNNEEMVTTKLALKEKLENEFVGITHTDENFRIATPVEVNLTFVCDEGLYKTKTTLKDLKEDSEFTYFIIENPSTLDFQNNRQYYRTLVEYDCIYTIETNNGIESFNAVTYDISAGGVSIITSENIVPQRETSIVIFMPERDLKTHLQFVRCESYGDDYKLSFIFTDLSERDFNALTELCVKTQLSSF